MKLYRLRARAAGHPEEPEEESFWEGLLEVLLCGLAAAAALMIVYSVLPKGGWNGDGGQSPQRALSRAEQRQIQRSTRGPAENALYLISIEAAPESGIEPQEVQLRGWSQARCWTEGNAHAGWRVCFVAHKAPPAETVSLVFLTADATRLEKSSELSVRLNFDGLIAGVQASYQAQAQVNSVRAVGYFSVTARPGSPAIPPQRRSSAPPAPEKEVSILQIHLTDDLHPITGITQAN